MNALAELFGGHGRKSYDDVSLEDAPYFSALYGPSRHEIVVPDLSQIAEQLEGLTDCPEDLYPIAMIRSLFDDSVFSALTSWKRRYRENCRPSVALFAFPVTAYFDVRRARNRIESLHAERKRFSERFATLSFDVQKTQRLNLRVQPFYRQPLSAAFEDDPKRKFADRTGVASRAERAGDA